MTSPWPWVAIWVVSSVVLFVALYLDDRYGR